MLVFAPGATDAGRFEDYARKMYSEYARLNVQTWIIGPASVAAHCEKNQRRGPTLS